MYCKAYCYNKKCNNNDYKLATKNKTPECPECGKEMEPVAENNHKL